MLSQNIRESDQVVGRKQSWTARSKHRGATEQQRWSLGTEWTGSKQSSAVWSTRGSAWGAAGSVASLWQQAGRAGRREQPSLSLYIGFDGPLDQFFMHQPENLFTRPIETAQVSPNRKPNRAYVGCMAPHIVSTCCNRHTRGMV